MMDPKPPPRPAPGPQPTPGPEPRPNPKPNIPPPEPPPVPGRPGQSRRTRMDYDQTLYLREARSWATFVVGVLAAGVFVWMMVINVKAHTTLVEIAEAQRKSYQERAKKWEKGEKGETVRAAQLSGVAQDMEAISEEQKTQIDQLERISEALGASCSSTKEKE